MKGGSALALMGPHATLLLSEQGGMTRCVCNLLPTMRSLSHGFESPIISFSERATLAGGVREEVGGAIVAKLAVRRHALLTLPIELRHRS